jgi:hypothetical protein
MLIQFLSGLFPKAFATEIQRATAMVPMIAVDPRDIFIVGYPKSGNTWLQNLVSGLVYGMDARLAPDKLIHELVPDVHYKRYFTRFATPTYFKSHAMPLPHYRKVVYILRDGRDVMVSYFHHLDALSRKTGVVASWDAILDERRGLFEGRHWHEHVDAWIANPYGAEMFLVRYEDLLEHPLRELQRLSDFFAISADESRLEEVRRNAAFDEMQRKEVKFGHTNPDWPKDRFFSRRGQAGSYRDEMPYMVRDRFEILFGPTLKRHGYIVGGGDS